MGVLFSDGANPASQAKTTGNVRQLSAEVPPGHAWLGIREHVMCQLDPLLRAVPLPETMVHGPGLHGLGPELERLDLH